MAQSDDIEITDSTSTGWDDDETGGTITPREPDEPVTSMTISQTALTLGGGESVRLAVSFNARARNKLVTWTVEDAAVCSVSGNGTVFGLRKGTTTVTATSVENNAFKCICQVTVTSDYEPPTEGWMMKKGSEEAWQMKYIFYPNLDEYVEPANDKYGRTWHDIDYDDSRWQTLTGPMNNHPGDDWITNYLWTGDWNCFCLRRDFVMPTVPVGQYVLHLANDDAVKVWINGQLIVNFDGWTHDFYQYEVPASVFVPGNNVLSIYIRQDYGDTDLDYGLWFEPRTPVRSISLSPRTLTLAGGESATVTATVLPEDAWLRDVTWSVSNPAIASVKGNGIVRGLKKGTATVRATTRDGSALSATCQVTVTSDYILSGYLPDVPFEFFYNAMDYDAVTHSIPNHKDANLAGTSLILTENIPAYIDNRLLRISDRCEGYLDRWDKYSNESGSYFNRGGPQCMTIVAKVAPRLNTGNACDFIANRGEDYNYMWRIGDHNVSFLHTGWGYDGGSRVLNLTSEEPQVLAVRVDGPNNCFFLHNLTTGECNRVEDIVWGGGDNIFKIFYNDGGEFFLGDFYWVYYSFELLSDDELEIFGMSEFEDGISRPNPAPSRYGGEVYDLSGRRVQKPTAQGIYIVNNRKILKH